MKTIAVAVFLVLLVPASIQAQDVYFGKEHYHPDSPCYMAGKQHYVNVSVISDSCCAPEIKVKQEIKEESGGNQINIGIVFPQMQEQKEESTGSEWQLSPFRHERGKSGERRPYVIDPQTGRALPVLR